MDDRIAALVAQLSLVEKVQLLTGRDFWSTQPIERIGLHSMVLSDGPSGVRGPSWDERFPSLNLPSASALSASWDTALAHRYGEAIAAEARRKGVDVVLGPTVNLHRSPLGGRHFEAYSEDPVLTAILASAFVSGVQESGVAATAKHFVANDSETERFTVDVRVDDRALHELYLLPFEHCVTAAGVWVIMSAYNSINGVTATESPLLEDPLNTDWGFDGVVLSDWTAVRSIESARASQDLAMPGPGGAWGAALVDAVADGRVTESAIDRKVGRILLLAERVGALGSSAAPPASLAAPTGDFAREAEIEGIVLLENNGELPWDRAGLSSIAVIGDNAMAARTQGGGSATVVPEYTLSPLEGIRAALPHADVSYSLGAVVYDALRALPTEWLRDPEGGTAGARLEFRDAAGRAIHSEERHSTSLVWFDASAPLLSTHEVEFSVELVPDRDELVRLGCATTGQVTMWLDGEEVLDTLLSASGDDIAAEFLAPASASIETRFHTEVPVRLRVRVILPENRLVGALSLTVGTSPIVSDSQQLILDAAAAAAAADVAIVVVGTNSSVESEGFDRSDLDLPGAQDALVDAVIAANPRTIVVVNAGAPVLMPWRHRAAAVLVGWFGGQEFGSAIAQILLGDAEPGGRLPTTWPDSTEQSPVLDTVPSAGRLEYSEGVHIGYRAWLKESAIPAYWLGHGLGFTTFETLSISTPDVNVNAAFFTVDVSVRNTGDRSGKHVVQLYVSCPDSSVERPKRWLVGFATTRVAPGRTAVVSIEVPTKFLAYWSDGWRYEVGDYDLQVGVDAGSMVASTRFTMH